ncbi:hypothetical protein CR513_04467, partial [Mucuna pruriens]
MSSDIFRVNAQRSHKTAEQTMLKVVKKQCYSWHNFQQMISQMLKRCGSSIQKGLSIEMKQHKFEVFQRENLIFETFMTTNHMFAISIKSGLSHNCFEVSSMPPAQHDMVKGLSIFKSPTQLCEHCLNFANIVHNKLIHSDICGLSILPLMEIQVWVYFLIGKGEALDVFKKFKVLVENKSMSLSKFCALIEGVFKDNSPHHIHHNKMA